MMWSLLLSAVLVVAVAAKRTLVLVETAPASHSQFLSSLEERGHDVTIKYVKDQDIVIKQYGELMFENILILAPGADELGNLQVADLVSFVDDGGNVLATADESLSSSSPIRDFAAECGVDFDRSGSVVMDHLRYDAADPNNDHTLIAANKYTSSKYVVGSSSQKGSVLFKGIGHAVDADNILAIRTLSGSPTTYSARPNKAVGSYPEAAGAQVGLVSSIQARNNARATFIGSFWMLSDEAFTSSFTGGGLAVNKYFIDQVSKWTFQEQGVLRSSNVRHHRADGSLPHTQLSNKEQPNLPVSIYPDPEVAPNSLVYRIKDDLVYKVDLEVNGDAGWEPFSADDVQLEFVMLDAFVRVNMEDDGSGTFVAKFMAPDTYGIYKFRVLYRRAGLSVVDLSTQVSLRPFRHNEYERFISSAFPYYASVVSMMVGFFVFSFFFLFSSST